LGGWKEPRRSNLVQDGKEPEILLVRPDRKTEGVRVAPAVHRPKDHAAPCELGLDRREGNGKAHEKEVGDGGKGGEPSLVERALEERALRQNESPRPRDVLVVVERRQRRRLRDARGVERLTHLLEGV